MIKSELIIEHEKNFEEHVWLFLVASPVSYVLSYYTVPYPNLNLNFNM